MVWLLFSFLLGGLPGFFVGAFTSLKLSADTELLGRGSVAGLLVGGVIGIIVFGFVIGAPLHFPRI